MVSKTNPPGNSRYDDKEKRAEESTRGMLSLVCLIISAISLGIALAGGAVVILSYFESKGTNGLWAKSIVLLLSYLVGWGAALFGIRKVGNLFLPYLIQGYTWLCLGGVGLLDILIISKLYKQAYDVPKFILYIGLMTAALIAMVGLHLLFEDHNLVPFAIPLLLISLGQLYIIVVHYVFVPVKDYVYLWGDLAFFIFMTTVGVLMMARLGVLSSVRRFIGNIFREGKA